MRLTRTPPKRDLSRAPLLAIGMVVLAGLSAIGVGVFGPRAPPRAAASDSSGIVVLGESKTCASINTNASLNGTYLSIYYVQAGSTNNSSASNQTPPTTRPGYPNATVGEAQLRAAWTTICASADYTALYDRLVVNQTAGTGFTIGGELNGSTGHYEVDYGFVYYQPCSNTTAGCEYFTTWHVDLATGGVTGPFTGSAGAPLGSSPGPRSAPSARLGARIPPILGLPGVLGYVVVGLVAAAVCGLLAVRARSRAVRPSPAPDPPGPGSQTGKGGSSPTSTALPKEPSSESFPRAQTDDPLGDVY